MAFSLTIDAQSSKRGDLNGDGLVSIADVMQLINIIIYGDYTQVAIGTETDHTNLCNPALELVNKACKDSGIEDDANFNCCPVPVEVGKTYYFYKEGTLDNLGHSNKRVVNANGEVVQSVSGRSIVIADDEHPPLTLYVNYRNGNSGTKIPVENIMVSTNGHLTEHHPYNANVDPLDHTPTLHDDPLKEILSRPSRARLFPIWGIIGGSFETGYTNGFRRDNDNAATFYDNFEGSELPDSSGWGYEWPTLFGKLNGAQICNYAHEGYSFYKWLVEYKGNNRTHFGEEGQPTFQAFIINMSGNEVGKRGGTGKAKTSSSPPSVRTRHGRATQQPMRLIWCRPSWRCKPSHRTAT